MCISDSPSKIIQFLDVKSNSDSWFSPYVNMSLRIHCVSNSTLLHYLLHNVLIRLFNCHGPLTSSSPPPIRAPPHRKPPVLLDI